jgi:hypothetical protein
MANYYFLITLLPSLSFSDSLKMTLCEFNEQLNENLTTNDTQKINIIRRYFDLFNLQAYWRGKKSDGVWSFQGLWPDYVQAFADKYQTNEEKVVHFSELVSAFFREESRQASRFFKEYLEFEYALHLIFLTLRAKKMGRDLLEELENEDSRHGLVVQILDQKESSEYEPPEPYEELKTLYEDMCHDPLALFQATNEYRFHKVSELVEGFDPFSFESLAAYFIQFLLVQRWQSRDNAKGLEVVDRLLRGAAS